MYDVLGLHRLMDAGKGWILAGAAISAGASFAPLAHLPIAGSVTYFLDGRGDGKWVILAAVAATVLALGRFYLGGVLAGLIVGGFLLFFDIQLQHAIDIAHERAAGVGMFGGLLDAMAQQIYLDWGYYAIATGAVGMLIGGVVGMVKRSAPSRLVDHPTHA